MKKVYVSLALAALCLPAYSQSKISLSGRLALSQMEQTVKADEVFERGSVRLMSTDKLMSTKKRMIGALVELSPGSKASDLERAGYEVSSDLGSVAVVRVDAGDIEALAELPEVKYVDFGRKQRLFTMKARPEIGVANVHNGFEYNEKPFSFTGKDVVCGIYDVGVMANHINFLNVDGTQRVKSLWHYYTETNSAGEEESWVASYPSPESVLEEFVTDSSEETHGTHTAGIMAGGYGGNAVVLDYDQDLGATNAQAGFIYSEAMENPYKGMAPESDIAIACGDLEDAMVIDGMSNIVDLARSEGKPCVINYSAGSNAGPHDGSDSFSKALSELSKDAVICVAAGNEGEDNISFKITGTTTFKTVVDISPYINQISAIIDFWASDEKPFTVEYFIYNKGRTGNAKENSVLTVNSNKNGAVVQATTSSNSNMKNGCLSGSQILATSEVNAANGRFNILSLVQAAPKSLSLLNTYYIGVKVTPAAGQTVYAYMNGYGSFESKSLSGYSAGNPDNSISNEACCPDIISVGAYTGRTMWGELSGSAYSSRYTRGSTAPFSSYGESFDGRKLPHVSAPGTYVVSSYSTPYIDGGTVAADSVGAMTAGAVVDGKRYFWGQMSGTSMATPVVSGVVALWMEADPSLSVSDVKEVMQLTSTLPDDSRSTDADRMGYGKINALLGVKEVLRRVGTATIGTVTEDELDGRVIVTSEGGVLDVLASGFEGYTVRVYNASGVLVRQGRSEGQELQFNVGGMPKGVYLVQVSTLQGLTVKRVML